MVLLCFRRVNKRPNPSLCKWTRVLYQERGHSFIVTLWWESYQLNQGRGSFFRWEQNRSEWELCFVSQVSKEWGKETASCRWHSSLGAGQLLADKHRGHGTRESHTKNRELEFRENEIEWDLTLGEWVYRIGSLSFIRWNGFMLLILSFFPLLFSLSEYRNRLVFQTPFSCAK